MVQRKMGLGSAKSVPRYFGSFDDSKGLTAKISRHVCRDITRKMRAGLEWKRKPRALIRRGLAGVRESGAGRVIRVTSVLVKGFLLSLGLPGAGKVVEGVTAAGGEEPARAGWV